MFFSFLFFFLSTSQLSSWNLYLISDNEKSFGRSDINVTDLNRKCDTRKLEKPCSFSISHPTTFPQSFVLQFHLFGANEVVSGEGLARTTVSSRGGWGWESGLGGGGGWEGEGVNYTRRDTVITKMTRPSIT